MERQEHEILIKNNANIGIYCAFTIHVNESYLNNEFFWISLSPSAMVCGKGRPMVSGSSKPIAHVTHPAKPNIISGNGAQYLP